MSNPKPDILLICDDDDMSQAIRENLVLEGYHVHSFSPDGELPQQGQFIIIIDHCMAYRAYEKCITTLNKFLGDSRIILLSCYCMEADARKEVDRGDAEFYFLKPFDIERLIASINEIVDEMNQDYPPPAPL